MPGWPEWADALVEQARADDTWERTRALVRDGGLTDEQTSFLAALGLAELAALADRLELDAARPCAGEAIARSRYAGMRTYLRGHAPRQAAPEV